MCINKNINKHIFGEDIVEVGGLVWGRTNNNIYHILIGIKINTNKNSPDRINFIFTNDFCMFHT